MYSTAFYDRGRLDRSPGYLLATYLADGSLHKEPPRVSGPAAPPLYTSKGRVQP